MYGKPAQAVCGLEERETTADRRRALCSCPGKALASPQSESVRSLPHSSITAESYTGLTRGFVAAGAQRHAWTVKPSAPHRQSELGARTMLQFETAPSDSLFMMCGGAGKQLPAGNGLSAWGAM